MYDCEVCPVELLCTNDLMKVIVDRFGEDVSTKPSDKKHFVATVDVAPSPTFYGWVFQFGGRVQITSPQSVIDKYKSMMKNI